jgi:hypothetical protein
MEGVAAAPKRSAVGNRSTDQQAQGEIQEPGHRPVRAVVDIGSHTTLAARRRPEGGLAQRCNLLHGALPVAQTISGPYPGLLGMLDLVLRDAWKDCIVVGGASCLDQISPELAIAGGGTMPGRQLPRYLLKCISAVIVLAATEAAQAEEVPTLSLDPVCRGISQQAKTPGERGGPDLAFAQCVKSEQAMRERLVKEWSTFGPADKAICVGEEKMGPLPSYTDLITCLEMARDARKMNTNK